MEKLKQLVALAIFVIFLVMSFIIGLDKENERPTQGLTMVEKETLHREEMTARFNEAVARRDEIPELLPEKEGKK